MMTIFGPEVTLHMECVMKQFQPRDPRGLGNTIKRLLISALISLFFD
jgi:hypothetical protein